MLNEKQIEANKELFKSILTKTNREKIDVVLDEIEKLGFFTAPASSSYHGNYPGGLVEHSLNVYRQAMYLKKVQVKLRPDLEDKLSDTSIAIVALLHDICKADLYVTAKKWRKDKDNKWEQYDTYEHDYNKEPFGHGEKSVIRLLRWGFTLTDDEIAAIRWHMGAFDISDYGDAKKGFNTAGDKYPLMAILVASDWLASRMLENRPGA